MLPLKELTLYQISFLKLLFIFEIIYYSMHTSIPNNTAVITNFYLLKDVLTSGLHVVSSIILKYILNISLLLIAFPYVFYHKLFNITVL